MDTTVIGGKVQATMTERDVNLLWQALKSLEKFGLPSGCVGTHSKEELVDLLATVTKTCNQRFTKSGALNATVAKDRAERQSFYGTIHNQKITKQREFERIAEERWVKLESEARKRRTYEYGLTYGDNNAT